MEHEPLSQKLREYADRLDQADNSTEYCAIIAMIRDLLGASGGLSDRAKDIVIG